MSNPLSSMSYTNKDFNSIFPELLDLVKKLTYKWDPTISNESDPGVVLLKLNAIIGDKNNYNIDKNILEAFPQTVTQDVNARNSYKQLGYRMPWYISATTDVAMKWVGAELASGQTITIPRYTMICDDEGSVVYTTTEEAIFTKDTPVTTVKATQGIIVQYMINGKTDVDIVDLDVNNRLYLDDYTISENGLFVVNSNDSSYATWKQVDNLEIISSGNKVYEFDVDARNNLCYIRFPNDIDSLIGSGLNIKYLISDGEQGVISAKTLTRFYEENTIKVNGEDIPLNSDIVQLYNISAATDGSDPESIESAYRSYRRVVNTFDTLVTLRDYMNAIYNSGLVSNDIVCDRTNDIQSSYRVMTDDEINPEYVYERMYTNSFGTIVDKAVNSFGNYISEGNTPEENTSKVKELLTKSLEESMPQQPELDPFDLKLYLLKDSGTVNTIDQYEESFKVVTDDSDTRSQVLQYISDQQTIQHDFKEILADRFFMFQNQFGLGIKIVPQTYLTPIQINDVKINIVKSLLKVTNSRAIDFGQEPNYDLIYDTIQTADERIKTVILDDFTYTTFAVYWDAESNQMKKIPVNNISALSSNQIHVFTSEGELENNLPFTEKLATYFVYTGPTGTEETPHLVNLFKSDSENTTYEYNLKTYDILRFIQVGESQGYILYSNKLIDFQKEIIIKSVLAGTTPLFSPLNDFKYSVTESVQQEVMTDHISTAVTIAPFTSESELHAIKHPEGVRVYIPNVFSTTDKTLASYTLSENETLRFFAPSFLTDKTFSNYVKFELTLNSDSQKTEFQDAVKSSSDVEFNKDYYITVEAYNACKGAVENQINYWGADSEIGQKWSNAAAEFENSWTKKVGESLYKGKFTSVTQQQGNIMVNKISDYDVVFSCAFGQLRDVVSTPVTLYQNRVLYQIPADSEYKLQEGESITFFWRDSDGDDAPYIYERYVGLSKETDTKKSPIIKPNFTINATTQDRFNSLATNYGTIPYGDELFPIINRMYGDNDLAGRKTIDIRKMNQVVLNSQKNKIYFITNKKNTKNEYELKLSLTHKDEDTNVCKYRYTLQNDEVFIYTSNNFKEYEVLTSGTMIGLSIKTESTGSSDIPEEIILTNKALTMQELAMGGIDYFAKYCKSIDSSYQDVFCREQQIYTIASGDTVNIVIDNIYEFKEANSMLKFINYESNSEIPVSQPCFCSWMDTIVKGITISCNTASGSNITLPKINISGNDNDYLWRGRAYLDINSSPDESQIINSRITADMKNVSPNSPPVSSQSMIVPTNDTETPLAVYPSIKNVSSGVNEEIYVKSSIPLNKIGGTNIDVGYFNGVGERQQVDFSFYTSQMPNPKVSEFKPELNPDGTLQITIFPNGIPSTSSECVVEQELSVDEDTAYIFAIQNMSDNLKFKLERLPLGASEESLYTSVTNLSIEAEEYPTGKYYFKLTNCSKLKITFTVLDPSKSEPLIALFYPMTKCQFNKILETKYSHLYTEDQLLKTMKTYDYKGLFKYDYSIKADDLINDPLEGVAFFNEHHVFNPFTIAKAELKTTDYSDSYITIINNR